ncbi:asparagine synthase (glutamine-hydrolyzing) [Streptomyces sp. A5-4]|uniref:asparagine synthase (glutamine-hydrolyzing) n=1 Tax=Streptomyces sp. A5-4 TaxID=3384771 RepID=UPI003DA8F404
MCRIFGSFATRVTRPELAEVSARQRHGGPDEHGTLVGPGWSLGCDRLAVTDPAHGRQPYRLASVPGVLVVLNGEIYNHHELRRRMAARGHRIPGACDGQVLPALYAEYGADFAAQLDGMFAVAVVDVRPGGPPQLVLAVDDMGMKGIYYHSGSGGSGSGGGVRFASELPALLAFRDVPADPREEALDSVLATRTPLGEATALRGVRTLPPGVTAVATGAYGLRVHRRTPRAPAPRGDARTVLRREVRRLARADVPLCAITSGGLDSGLVTALAAEHARAVGAPPPHSFHLTYRGRWPGAEHGYARAVARRAGTVHHQVELDPAEFAELLPRAVQHLGQPNADPITLSTYALFRAVREAGFTVALTGDGADELFGGYDRVRAALAAPPGADWVSPYVEALAAVPRPLREWLYTPAYRALIADRGSDSERIAADLRAAPTARIDTVTGFETRHRLPAYHLRRVDHLSMAWAVEARMPFCQPAMAALAGRLPAAARTGKRALYAAGRGLVPEAVLRRPKQPFTLPLGAMLTAGSPLMELARDTLSPGRVHHDGRLRADRVQALLARQAARPTDTTALAVWALLVHELWRGQPAAGSVPVRVAA